MAYTTIPASTGGSGGNGLSGWFGTEAAAHLAAIPSFTSSIPIQLGVDSTGGVTEPAYIADAGVEGGALKGTGNSAWAFLTKATIYQNVATSKFAVSFQASLPTIGATSGGFLALVAAAGAKYVAVCTSQGLGGAATTDFVLAVYDGASGTPVSLGTYDSGVHTWRMVSDGTTVTVYKDGVSAGTMLTSATHYPTGTAMFAGMFGAAVTTGFAVYRCLYSFVGQ